MVLFKLVVIDFFFFFLYSVTVWDVYMRGRTVRFAIASDPIYRLSSPDEIISIKKTSLPYDFD